MPDFVQTELAPKAIGCYSQAVSEGKTLYLSGQIALDPVSGQLIGETFEAQLIQVLTNISSVLQAGSSDLTQVLKLTVYIKNFAEDYPKLNGVMENFFQAPFPARSAVGVAALPKDALVEVDAIALIPG
ncbi:MAG: RidA family protein [Gammaproteobacteria bacterium]|jgi:reactive intermediate/imine deaminase|nr:RidA family protein [Gammaproteobacteria bacterium]